MTQLTCGSPPLGFSQARTPEVNSLSSSACLKVKVKLPVVIPFQRPSWTQKYFTYSLPIHDFSRHIFRSGQPLPSPVHVLRSTIHGSQPGHFSSTLGVLEMLIVTMALRICCAVLSNRAFSGKFHLLTGLKLMEHHAAYWINANQLDERFLFQSSVTHQG